MSRTSRTPTHRGSAAPDRRRRLGARRLRAVAVAGLVVVLAPVALAAPASAHDSLTGSSPGDGATVTKAPDRVRLTFTDEVQDIGLTVLVKDPSGASVADGEPRTDGNAVVQPVSGLTAAGRYTVAYRVVSSDGHPISGRLTFTLALPTASASPSATSTGQPTPVPSTTSSDPGPSAGDVAASPAASTTDASSGSAWLVAGAGLLIALVLAGVVLARRRSA